MNKKFSLPEMSFQFKIQIKGQETEQMWTGNFRYHRPTLGERARIESMRVRLNGDLETLDQEVLNFNEAISHLRFTLDEYPDWWKDTNFGTDLYDGNVIAEVYGKVLEFEAKFRERVYSDKQDGVKIDVDTDKSQSPSEIIGDVAQAGEI